jgi:rhamnosyltransferase
MSSLQIPIKLLGQSGCRMEFAQTVVYVDPYLSNSVQELDNTEYERLIPLTLEPDQVLDADWVLLTHEHIDHCDPHTLPKLAQSSPQARFIGPPPVLERLRLWGVSEERLFAAPEGGYQSLSDSLKVIAVPAAHPELIRNKDGRSLFVGFVLDWHGRRVYHAGDTALTQEVLDGVKKQVPIHTAFLPVNERNFFRDRKGIVGNMTVREAFGLAQELQVQQVVAVHWDMFAVNSVDPEEIRLLHQKLKPNFSLLLRPEIINLAKAQISVVIRTLNEERYLRDLLRAIARQDTDCLGVEVVLVDSGSTDDTLKVAEAYGCKTLHVRREDFSFGRSLNVGCEAAQGEYLVITSGHCVPVDDRWLKFLVEPLVHGKAEYVYGRQLGGPQTAFSEARIFSKYFPEQSAVPQSDSYCNNANSALLKSSWRRYRFNEELTGLEDIELAQRLQRGGGKLGYVADAAVYHYHHETWAQVRRRFEREAIALQRIMPQLHVSFWDVVRYVSSSVWRDMRHALREGRLFRDLHSIVLYRCNQYWGSYSGNHDHRLLSRYERERYFFPERLPE